jgi:hypothetical protein
MEEKRENRGLLRRLGWKRSIREYSVFLVALLLLAISNLSCAEDLRESRILHLQFYRFSMRVQNYSVQVFKDGRVRFDGWINKQGREGSVEYVLEQDKLTALMKIVESSPLVLPSSEIKPLSYMNHHLATVTVALDGKQITTEFRSSDGRDYFFPLMREIESYLGTAQIRCRVLQSEKDFVADMCYPIAVCVIVTNVPTNKNDICGNQPF